MKHWKTQLMVWLQVFLIQGSSSSRKVNLCCSQSQVLDIINNQCTDNNKSNRQTVADLVTNFVNSDIEVNDGSHPPACRGSDSEHFSLRAEEGKITPEGHLVTKKYGEDFIITDYCLTASGDSDDVVAVTCNPCSTGQVRGSGCATK